MTQIYVDDSRGRGKLAAAANAMQVFLAAQERRRQEEREAEAIRQQQQDAIDRAQANEFGKLRPEQKRDMWGKLSEGAKRYTMDPASVSAPVPTTREQLDEMAVADSLARFPTLTDAERRMGTYNTAYGAAMPSEGVKTTIARDIYGNPAAYPPEMMDRQLVDDKLRMDAAQQDASGLSWDKRERIEVPESQVGIRKTKAETGKIGAETGKIGAETGKIREETTTEIQSRDPDSPTSRAKAITGGRKSGAQIAIEKIETRLAKHKEKVVDLEIELAGTTRASEKKALGAKLTKAREVVAADQKELATVLARAEQKSVPVQPRTPPAAPQQLTAVHPETKQRIVSKDGGNTWVDAATGRPVRVE